MGEKKKEESARYKVDELDSTYRFKSQQPHKALLDELGLRICNCCREC